MCATALLLLGGCGGDDDPPAASTTTITVPTASTTMSVSTSTEAENDPGTTAEAPEDKPSGPSETAEEDPRLTALEASARRTAREYYAAIGERDAASACALLAPGAADAVPFPRQRGGCEASLAASLGYRDPRGLPVWEGTRVIDAPAVKLTDGGASARAITTVATDFADRDEASIEDDVLYLVRAGSSWLVAQPSVTLYRAVGVEAPPTAIAPPTPD